MRKNRPVKLVYCLEDDTMTTPAAFRAQVWRFYRTHGRHSLPWRHTRDPYEILVSEIMLQQTQVERVVPFYWEFLRRFPTVRALAKAPLGDVLRAWQGLGYNRRAKHLRAAAKALVTEHRGAFPKTPEALERLPGVGPYTARAIAAFAYNKDVIFIETNIRTAVIHHFFNTNATIYRSVSDAQIEKILAKVLPKGKSHEWYWALVDYGSFLKRSGVKLNAQSRHYAKQSAFRGSLREARGAILRELAKGSRTEARLVGLLGDDRRAQLRAATEALLAERLIQTRGGRCVLAA